LKVVAIGVEVSTFREEVIKILILVEIGEVLGIFF
jgi:hypothetical protein